MQPSLSIDIQELESLFHMHPDGVLICNSNGKIIFYNDAFLSTSGFDKNKIADSTIDYVLSQFTSLAELNLLKKVIKTGTPASGEMFSFSNTLLPTHYQCIYSPIKDGSGNVAGIICMIRDVSNIYGTGDTEVQQLIHRITHNLPGVVYEYTVRKGGEGRFIYISPQTKQLLGLLPGDILRNPKLIEGLIHEDDKEGFKNSSYISNVSAANWRWEGRIRVGNEIKWIETKSSAELQPDGAILWHGIITDITERKLTQQRLELALKGADLGSWDYNFKDKSIFISENWARTLGYTQKELEDNYQRWSEFIHPEDAGYVKELVSAHVKGKTEFYESVYRFKTKTGLWRWIMERGQVVERDKDGKALRWVGTLQDFHIRKLSEKVLRESEKRHRDLIEHLPFGVVVHIEGVVQFVNQQFLKILGYQSVDQLIGKNVLKFVPEQYHDAMLERKKIVEGGKSTDLMELQIYKANGDLVDVEVKSMAFEFNDSPASQTLVNDISERKRVQDAIRKNEKLYTQLFQNAPVAVVLLDEHHLVMQSNKGFEKMFGYSEADIKGKSLNTVIVPENLLEEGESLNRKVIHNEVTIIETVRAQRGGKLIPVIIYGFPVILEKRTIGIYGVYVDISVQKSIEDELNVRNTELDNFVYKVSHDLRAPLSSVLGLVNLARMEQNDDDLKEYIKIIGNKVEQLDKFITDVLSHSKNLKMELSIAPVDFKEIVRETFSNLNYLRGAESATYRLKVKGGGFMSDPWRLSEILRNLFSNAIKYRRVDLKETLIYIDVDITKEHVNIRFSDNGIGISKENLTRIFEMFYRATEQADGSGIGLYIVKNAVDKLGGTISVESEPDNGTTFIITLPNRAN